MDKKATNAVTERQKFEERVERQVDRMFDKFFTQAVDKHEKTGQSEMSYAVLPMLWNIFSSDKFKKAYMDRLVRKYDRFSTETWRVSFSCAVNAIGYGPTKIVFTRKGG